MPTDLPLRPSFFIKNARRLNWIDKDEREFLLVFCFALSPLAVLIMMFLLLSPTQMIQSLSCGDTICIDQ